MMMLHVLTSMNVPLVFTTEMSMFLTIIVIEKIALMLLNLKLKIHLKTMAVTKILKDLTAVVTRVMSE